MCIWRRLNFTSNSTIREDSSTAAITICSGIIYVHICTRKLIRNPISLDIREAFGSNMDIIIKIKIKCLHEFFSKSNLFVWWYIEIKIITEFEIENIRIWLEVLKDARSLSLKVEIRYLVMVPKCLKLSKIIK